MTVSVTSVAGTLVLAGDLDAGTCAAFNEALAAVGPLPARQRIDLGALELLDSDALLVVVDALRGLLARGVVLELLGSPQLLAHSLYRVGLLEAGSAISLVDTREEEPYG